MPEVTTRVLLAVLALVFAWAAGAKLLRPAQWRRALESYAFPRGIALVALWVTPLMEGAVVVLALVGRGRAAAAIALVLLGAFTGALLRARALHGERVPCGCFGKTTERPVSLMLWRNAGLAVCAVIVLAAGSSTTLFAGMHAPGAADVVPVVLVVIGIAVAAWSLRSAFTSLGGPRA